MKLFTLVAYSTCLVAAVLGRSARFDNYRVYSAAVENEEQSKVLRDLETSSDGILFLKTPTPTNRYADFIAPPHKFGDISKLLDTFNIKNHVKTENLQK